MNTQPVQVWTARGAWSHYADGPDSDRTWCGREVCKILGANEFNEAGCHLCSLALVRRGAAAVEAAS